MTDDKIISLDDIISEKDLRLFSNCPYSYYLDDEIGTNKIPWTGTTARKILFLNERKELFNVNTSDTRRLEDKQRRAGPEIKHVEKMSSEELREFTNSPAGSLKYKWFDMNNQLFGRSLAWNFKQESGKLGSILHTVGDNYYSFVLKNGVPDIGTIDYSAVFFHEDFALKTRLPELRKGMFIDDPDLYSAKDLNTRTMITMRILGYCTLAHENPLLRLRWGIPDEIAEKWGGNEMYIDPQVSYRHIDLSNNSVQVTHRSDEDLENLIKLLNRFVSEKEKRPGQKYKPISTNKTCGNCSYNVMGINGEVICRHAYEKATPAKPIELL